MGPSGASSAEAVSPGAGHFEAVQHTDFEGKPGAGAGAGCS